MPNHCVSFYASPGSNLSIDLTLFFIYCTSGEAYSDTWSLDVTTLYSVESGEIFQAYSRPVYTYVSGLPDNLGPIEGDDLGELHTAKDNECQDIQTAKVLTSKEYDFYALLTSSCVFWEPMVSVGWNVPSTR